MTATELSAIAGVVLSLIFSYVPGLSTWFAGKSSEVKSLVMLAVLVATAAGIYGVGCLGWFDTGIACTGAGALELGKILLVAVIANQSTHRLMPETLAVREAKLYRLP